PDARQKGAGSPREPRGRLPAPLPWARQGKREKTPAAPAGKNCPAGIDIRAGRGYSIDNDTMSERAAILFTTGGYPDESKALFHPHQQPRKGGGTLPCAGR